MLGLVRFHRRISWRTGGIGRTEAERRLAKSEGDAPTGVGRGTAEHHGGMGTGIAPFQNSDHEETPAVRQGRLL